MEGVTSEMHLDSKSFEPWRRQLFGGNNDAADYDPVEPSSNSNTVNEVDKSSPEVFPLVLGSLLIIAAVSFTAFTLFVVFRKWRDNHESDEDDGVQDSTRERKTTASFLNSHAVGDEGDLDNSWVYGGSDGDEGELDVIEEVGEEAIMSWSELSCSYPSKKGDDIKTLSAVTGHIRYKELVAIMGGSGGGKSTLMDILSGRKTLGKLGGEMSVLGESMAPDTTDCKDILRDVAAYVPQNEQFFPNQTPEEAVGFVANLKLGKDERGDDVRKRRITQILDLIGIPKEARKRAIGGTLAGGVVIRGLSGGERKRLALACAIAMKPKLLFLDEITSGLDSDNAVLVIDLIKKLCVNMNVAAVVVIHQPSYEVFSHFDRLILLSKGKCVYADKLDQIPSFYDEIGRSMPEKHLVPNDIINAASNWEDNKYTLSNQPSELVKSSGKKLLQEIKNRKKPSMLLQFKTVLLRQMVNHYVRNLTNLLARVLIYGMTALLVGAIFWKIAETEDNQPLSVDQAQAAFGAGIFLTQTFYLLPFSQISTFFFDKNLFAAESSMGLYPAWIYSLVQVTLEVWVMALCALVQTAIAIPMMSLWNPSVSNAASFVTMFTVFCIGGIMGNAIVLLTSILMWSQDVAFLVGSANVVFFGAASGGFVPFPSIPDWIVWVQWISPIKYSFQAFTWCLLSETPTTALLEMLELDTPSSVSSNVAILIVIFVLCATGSVIALSRQREVR